MLISEGDKLSRVVVCTPEAEYFNVSDISAHNITRLADQDNTKQQHNKLKSILQGFGCEVIDIPELPNHPNSVFTRDTSLCTPGGYIILLKFRT
jgi:N-dimethylarginine dimethylaminohydrolase